MAVVSGWLATAAIVLAALVPIVHRLRAGKRAPPGAPSVRLHVVVGMATAALAFAHTIAVIPALGSPAAIAGGVVALVPGGLAFFLLIAHSGIGLSLRSPTLRARAQKRRQHVTTATLIAIAVLAHAVLLERARG